jgi:hypothetical protein
MFWHFYTPTGSVGDPDPGFGAFFDGSESRNPGQKKIQSQDPKSGINFNKKKERKRSVLSDTDPDPPFQVNPDPDTGFG